MDVLVGENANVTMQVKQLNDTFEESFGEIIGTEKVALIQWAESNFLSDPAFSLSNVTAYGSMNDLGMDFLKAPELYNSGSGLVLAPELTQSLFAPYDENSVIE